VYWWKGHGYCVGKASLYVRALPCHRDSGAARVSRRQEPPRDTRLLEAVGTDLFAYHGYVRDQVGPGLDQGDADLSTSACARDGRPAAGVLRRGRALLQPFDARAASSWSYVTQHGTFFDVPAKFLMAR